MNSRSKVLSELDTALLSIDKAASDIAAEEKGLAKPIIKKLGLAVAEVLHAQKLIKELNQSGS